MMRFPSLRTFFSDASSVLSDASVGSKLAYSPVLLRSALFCALMPFAFVGTAFAQDDAAHPEHGDRIDDAAADEEALPNVELVRTPSRAMPEGTPLLENKKFPMAGRFELTGSVDLSYGERYIKQYGGHLAVGYHVFDWLTVEAYGGYLGVCAASFDPRDCELNITKYARDRGRSAGENDPIYLSGLWQTNFNAGLTVQWAPIYGKLSAVSEYDLNFQLYFMGGAGVDGLWKVKTNRDGNSIGTEMELAPTIVMPSMHFGAGLRFIPWKYVALRAELRNYVHVAPGPQATPGGTAPEYELGFNSMINLGASILF